MPHQRRKSGPYTANSSTTDVRKTVTATPAQYKRPAMTRRQTPSSAQKPGRVHREPSNEVWDNDERESFPQFWYGDTFPVCDAARLLLTLVLYSMTCEKQFVPYDEMFLYCSDTYVDDGP